MHGVAPGLPRESRSHSFEVIRVGELTEAVTDFCMARSKLLSVLGLLVRAEFMDLTWLCWPFVDSLMRIP